LLRDEEVSKVALSGTYESLDKFLVALVQHDAAVNPAFIDENKVLVAVLNKALGTSCGYAADSHCSLAEDMVKRHRLS
jgi:hypothetical protein